MFESANEKICASEQQCVWKQVMNDSLVGNATSYDIRELTDRQSNCLLCSGYRRDCSTYLPRRTAEVTMTKPINAGRHHLPLAGKGRDGVTHIMLVALIIGLLGGCEGAAQRVASDDDAGTDGDTDTDSDGDSDTDTDMTIGDGGVIEMDCSNCPAEGGTVENMVCAIDLCNDDVVEDAIISTPENWGTSADCDLEDAYEAIQHFGDSTNDLAPRLNGSYALFGTGNVQDEEGVFHGDTCTDGELLITDPWYPEEDFYMFDILELRLDLVAPSMAKAFRFDYVFFSAEYDEWVNSIYNDSFYAILQADSTNDGAATIINFTECRDPESYYDFICESGDTGCEEDEEYCYIAINSAFSECCWYPHGSAHAPNPNDPACPGGTATTDITGTGFECAANASEESPEVIDDVYMAPGDIANGSSTGWLRTTWPIEGGEAFTLTFHIHDTNDSVYDSEVIMDAFRFLADEDQGTEPIE